MESLYTKLSARFYKKRNWCYNRWFWKCIKRKRRSENANKWMKQQSANKILKKKDNKDYKSINSYKPSGNFIYDKNMMLKIQDMTN